MEDFKNIFSDGTGDDLKTETHTVVPDFTSIPDNNQSTTQIVVKEDSDKLEEVEKHILSAIQDGSREIPSSDMLGIVEDIKSDTIKINQNMQNINDGVQKITSTLEDYIYMNDERQSSMISYITAINENFKLASKIAVAEISLIVGIIVIFMFIGRFR